MAISELFEVVCCSSCGLCCSKDILCKHCEVSTLKSNGLSEDLVPEISGLSKIWPGNRGFKYSLLYNKLQELMKANHQLIENGKNI